MVNLQTIDLQTSQRTWTAITLQDILKGPQISQHPERMIL